MLHKLERKTAVQLTSWNFAAFFKPTNLKLTLAGTLTLISLRSHRTVRLRLHWLCYKGPLSPKARSVPLSQTKKPQTTKNSLPTLTDQTARTANTFFSPQIKEQQTAGNSCPPSHRPNGTDSEDPLSLSSLSLFLSTDHKATDLSGGVCKLSKAGHLHRSVSGPNDVELVGAFQGTENPFTSPFCKKLYSSKIRRDAT